MLTICDRARRRALTACICLLALIATGIAPAQTRLTDDTPARPSPIAPVLERIDEALRQRLTAADDAASRWMAGEFETLDVAARARDFAAAAARAPSETLYLASLARACVARTVPTLPECASRDAVASFATRDPDNAVPWILLAERARQRRLPAADVAGNLERAAKSPRFDDYTQRSAPLYAAAIRALPGGGDRAVDAVAAARYVDRAAGGLAPALAALCGPKRELPGETVGRACVRIAALMIERAPNAADQAMGASLAGANAASDSARALADSTGRAIAARRQRCTETFDHLARIAAGPAGAADAKARDAAAAWPDDRARLGELAACERLAAGLATTK